MPTITVRIPEDLKKRMRRIKGVNWSEVIRKAILERVMIEERLRERDWSLVEKAAGEIDKLRMEIQAMYGRCDYDSAETIRCWRDARYGEDSS